ncbi:16S rRNA (adenine(1518)-N(6)/adenine(1519)-N(6))-dimethyltransferase RsmA [Gammaproteobacteria bacterium]|nr:16S rRNA (adenine(1518)-N(6)/adenine(1519)-N(6))-dimethyltransferase RsmA [Gammaproteobacteria bacterium]
MVNEHRARKRFGQNFLHNPGIIDRIIAAVNPGKTDYLIEIGPGQGALTDKLVDHCCHLDVIEIDRDLAAVFQQRYADKENFTLHTADVLKFDFASLPLNEKPYKVIGNLPYNISTPLIFRLLSCKHLFSEMLFMLQLEVVNRMSAGPGSKSYGRLSIMTQYHCKVEKLFSVPPTAFKPQPKVDSAIVRLVPWAEPPFPAKDPVMLETVVRTAFSQRRKTLQNSLKTLLDKSLLQALSIDGKRRPETLSLAEYVSISNALGEDHL